MTTLLNQLTDIKKQTSRTIKIKDKSYHTLNLFEANSQGYALAEDVVVRNKEMLANLKLEDVLKFYQEQFVSKVDSNQQYSLFIQISDKGYLKEHEYDYVVLLQLDFKGKAIQSATLYDPSSIYPLILQKRGEQSKITLEHSIKETINDVFHKNTNLTIYQVGDYNSGRNKSKIDYVGDYFKNIIEQDMEFFKKLEQHKRISASSSLQPAASSTTFGSSPTAASGNSTSSTTASSSSSPTLESTNSSEANNSPYKAESQILRFVINPSLFTEKAETKQAPDFNSISPTSKRSSFWSRHKQTLKHLSLLLLLSLAIGAGLAFTPAAAAIPLALAGTPLIVACAGIFAGIFFLGGIAAYALIQYCKARARKQAQVVQSSNNFKSPTSSSNVASRLELQPGTTDTASKDDAENAKKGYHGSPVNKSQKNETSSTPSLIGGFQNT